MVGKVVMMADVVLVILEVVMAVTDGRVSDVETNGASCGGEGGSGGDGEDGDVDGCDSNKRGNGGGDGGGSGDGDGDEDRSN